MNVALNRENVHSQSILKALQDGLTVSLISTKRINLLTCDADEDLPTVAQRNRANDFDFLPVLESRGDTDGKSRRTIIGLIEIALFKDDPPQKVVSEHMQPLSEKNLIGADASILDFVRDADHQRCRLLVSGPEVSGLVSLFDLQQLPARAALFAMITQLEITMADRIRREFNYSTEWLGHLSSKKRNPIKFRINDAKKNDTYVDALLFTDFGDKATIVKKSKSFSWQNMNFDDELDRIRKLRNAIAHTHDYAATQSAARQVCQTVRLMESWIERLTL